MKITTPLDATDITFILKYDRIRLNGTSFNCYERWVLALERSLMYGNNPNEKRTSLMTKTIQSKLQNLNRLLQKDEVFLAYCSDESKVK
jgi:hypothetical protein